MLVLPYSLNFCLDALELYQCGPQCSNPHAYSCLSRYLFIEEKPGKNGNLDQHGAIDDAGLHGADGPQSMIP